MATRSSFSKSAGFFDPCPQVSGKPAQAKRGLGWDTRGDFRVACGRVVIESYLGYIFLANALSLADKSLAPPSSMLSVRY